jgi:hypothetical protein
MGYGNYSQEAHQALVGSRTSLKDEEVFRQRSTHALMNPMGLKLRESRDSAAHPNSLGVAFALDVTGSMGDIPVLLARRELPRFMRILADCGFTDAQILFMAVGDAFSDSSPLQVGQFESSAELMDQWLTQCHLEAGGGGSGSESYELALYALARHTEMDCWTRRSKRGYLFMTGDEKPYPAVSREHVGSLIGDRLDEDVPVAEVVAAAQRTFHPFFLIPDLERRQGCERSWRELLGDHVVCMEKPLDTCFVAASLLALTEGRVAGLSDLRPLLEGAGADPERVAPILRAVAPYAASLGLDGSPLPALEDAAPPAAGGESGFRRLPPR